MSAVHPDAKSADFRLAMREFASGVAIVTCANGKERAGCTATALASLSLSPPSLVICLERSSSTLAILTQAGAFAVNILAAQHGALASRFAGGNGLRARRDLKKAIGLRSRPALPLSSMRSPRWTAASRRLSHATPMRSSSATCKRSASAARGQGFCTGAAGSRRWIELSFSRPSERNGLLIRLIKASIGCRFTAPPSPGSIRCRQPSARFVTLALPRSRRMTGNSPQPCRYRWALAGGIVIPHR